MYCDNYCPINLKKNFLIFKKKSLITLSICEKKMVISQFHLIIKLNIIVQEKKIKLCRDWICYVIQKFLNLLTKIMLVLIHILMIKEFSEKISAAKIDNKYLVYLIRLD